MSAVSAASFRTTCPYCGVGCGVIATARADGGLDIAGDPDHPANFGRLCSKGSALGETMSLDDRLLHPMVDGARTSWNAALDHVARRFRETIAAHGPDSVAFYVSGQLLTEDYYVANKLMKGFIGSANIDTNSRLCMASSVAGHKRAFGSDTVPGCYEDLEEADLVVLVGSNLAWCHPVLYQRIAAARQTRGGRPTVVVIDPRRTATCEIADHHLALAPDTDVALFNGLLRHIADSGALDQRFVDEHTTGFAAAIDAAGGLSQPDVANITGLSEHDLTSFYDLFKRTERVVTVYSQGVNQSAVGTDKVNAIINGHLATGRIGRPGMGPFSVTGQPNAMGGREVGGLANMLAAHMEIGEPAHRALVQGFWAAPTIATRPGLKAVDMFRAVGDGRVKAIWIMATNPVVSMPEADIVRSALRACPLVVVSDVVRDTDTTAWAHVRLPSLAWGEKDGTVTNSERRISRQRAVLLAPGEARPDWWQLAEVARRMGWSAAFAWRSSAEIFDEHARLSALANQGTRDFDIGALSGLDRAGYDALAPVHWPARTDAAPARRMFADGRFFTPDGRARFVATPVSAPAQAGLAEVLHAGHPQHTERPGHAERPGPALAPATLVLDTGRIRDQWHTMTRTAKAPRLMSHIAEPFVEVHPTDAAHLGLVPAHIARIASAHGDMLARVVVTERQRPGSVFVPMHWTDQFASRGRVDALVPATVDPFSGQPALKHARVTVEPWPAGWFATAVTRHRPSRIAASYWALAPIDGGWRLELADRHAPSDIESVLHALLGEPASAPIEIVAYRDRAGGQDRLAAFAGDRLLAALYAGHEPVAASRAWLAGLLADAAPPPSDRQRLLAGRPGAGQRDPGPIVCACFGVGRNDIAEAIATLGSTSVAAVGVATKAGTNCGSCRTEIARQVDDARPVDVEMVALAPVG